MVKVSENTIAPCSVYVLQNPWSLTIMSLLLELRSMNYFT